MNPFAYGVALLFAFTLQITWAGLLEVGGVTPDLLLLLGLVAAWRAPARAAIVACWAAGLAKDLGSSAHLGSHAALFALAGAAISLGRSLLYLEHPVVQMAVGFFGAAVVNGGFLCGSVLTGAEGAPADLALRVLGAAAYTACCAPFVLGPLDRIRPWLGIGERSG